MKECKSSIPKLDIELGFTLIELMVVLLIIAILVGIVVPVLLNARKNAMDVTAKHNLRVGSDCVTNVHLDLIAQNVFAYQDPGYGDSSWARYMSSKETKIAWVELDGANKTLRYAATYERDEQVGGVAGGNPHNWSLVYGNVAVYRGYLDDRNFWVQSEHNDDYRYMTVLGLSQSDDTSYFSCYDEGVPIVSGTFYWNDQNGQCSGFVLD